ncbi:conserved hypothetical protein [Talaromyces stipitatus ATCC 10500]|uniref:Uncharacterized protein n=1 Tax=Talaromyces stipitatus (strain ATCC 10500 / CBS 375.48 / QM 6759 / NRRL 1006) TaxID=441959 RepID=B8MJN1_TALSN|nr:uncharacterized protein TSTA_051670 [Talaromyces stipitatus ATCC 10500]EED15730.1 conserved hypothetical protein [Talaromyces stipitatus ATCC 10500]
MKAMKFGMQLEVLLLGAFVFHVDAVQSKESFTEDLTHWKEQPVAFLARGYPNNSTEMFFSGNVVIDEHNTSGFGKGHAPWVAMYTSFYPSHQVLPSGKQVRDQQQAQSIAYSLDHGATWTTYDDGNPIILDPPSPYQDQYLDFRDPNIFWYEPIEKWVAISVSQNFISSSYIHPQSLKQWNLESEFGPFNAVGGNWECPNLFTLHVDGDDSKVEWVAIVGVNPGGPPGTYSWRWPSDGSIVFEDFEGNRSFADRGWVATGDLIGTSPVAGTLPGQNPVTGFLGNQLVNTFLNVDSTTGILTSPSFDISYNYINLLVGGGDNINQTAIRLKIDGNIVHATTGSNSEHLPGKTGIAVIEIIDLATGDWGHINVGEISFANSRATNDNANWLDWGPDFYAAQSYNGIPQYQRTIISWMNNWQYGAAIPTSPWRSAMAIPPSEDFSQHDSTTQQVFIDRTKSGDVSFDSTLASVYYAPLSPALNNTVTLHIFVDWSSVEVFGGQGQTTITTQIFPPKMPRMRSFSTGETTDNVQLRKSKVRPTWTSELKCMIEIVLCSPYAPKLDLGFSQSSFFPED